MEPEDIRSLRKRLGLSMRDVAERLEVEVSLVMAWESGERYPTKKHVEEMRAWEGGEAPPTPAKLDLYSGALSDPKFFAALRKLLAHPELQEELLRAAERYPDPAKR